jgi:hypothetical protein
MTASLPSVKLCEESLAMLDLQASQRVALITDMSLLLLRQAGFHKTLLETYLHSGFSIMTYSNSS